LYFEVKKEIHILMLEDDSADAELTRFALKKGGVSFSLARVDSEDDYVRQLEDNPPALILSDYSLPGFNGHDALDIALKKCPETPFIFVTGTMGEEVAIETLKSGATDYVLKTRLSRLVPAVMRALRESEERTQHRRAEEQLRESHERLRALSVYLQTVREEERTRIAREVHDEGPGADQLQARPVLDREQAAGGSQAPGGKGTHAHRAHRLDDSNRAAYFQRTAAGRAGSSWPRSGDRVASQ
jgi:CheY-like chemotaxis protein